MSEIEHLRQFREYQSESAFAALVRRHAGFVYAAAKRRVNDAHQAEDIAQLVFIRLARNPPRVETPHELLGWLHRTTINVSIDLWRADRRRKAREEQAAPMQTSTPDWNVICPELDEALDRLSDDDRQVILLRFLSAASMRDVGAAFGITEDAAKMRVSRALERLRSQLGITHASCTGAVLGALLLQHSVEAAPPRLIEKLLKIRVAAFSGAAASGSLLSRLFSAPAAKLAAVLALTAGVVCVFHMWRTAQISNQASGTESKPAPAASAPKPDPALASDHTTPQPPPPQSETNINFRLTVVEAASGTPLPGARVRYAYFGSGGEGESRNTVTDDSGEAVILKPDDPQKGGPNVFVSKEWHVPKCAHLGRETAVKGQYTIALETAREISGWVVDEDNQPVPDVTIHVQGPGVKPGETESVDFQTCPATTREDGSWSCAYIPLDYTNEIRLVLKKPGFAVTFPVIPVPQVELTRLLLVIDRGFTIIGQVTDAQGRPLAEARVRTLNWNSGERKSAQTDNTGQFVLPGVSPYGDSVYTFTSRQVVTNAAAAYLIRGPAPASSPDKENLSQLENSRRAVEQRLAEIEESLANPDSTSSSRASTGNLGTMRDVLRKAVEDTTRKMASVQAAIANPSPFQADLAVQAEGFASRIVTARLETPTNNVQIVMAPGNILRGVVRDTSGNPVANALVRTDMNFENQIQTQFDWKGRTDDSGRFEWNSAPAEPACYWFAADGYVSVRGLSLPADATEHAITLKRRGE